MTIRKIAIGFALCLLLSMFGFGMDDNPYMGTWKLNEAKSKFAPGASKNTTVVYEATGDNMKVTADGVDGSGNPAHNEWTRKFDGNDYPVTGDPTSDSRSYKADTGYAMSMTLKKGGKIVGTGRVVVAADGKSRTVTTHMTDSKGAKVTSTAVYGKQ